MATPIQAFTDLWSEIQSALETKDTEAAALAASTSKPNKIFYTSDTHKIIIGGQEYGGGSITVGAFAYASDTSAMSSWDTSKIYIVPTSTTGVFQVYQYEANTWEMPGTINLNLPHDAANVTYDPQHSSLEATNVQDAIDYLKTDVVDEIANDVASNTTAITSLQEDMDKLIPVRGHWADIFTEVGVDGMFSAKNYACLRSTDNVQSTSSYSVLYLNVKDGERYRIEGVTRSSTIYGWALYDGSALDNDIMTSGTQDISLGFEYCDPVPSSDTDNWYTELTIEAPGSGFPKDMLVLTFKTDKYANGTLKVYKWVEEEITSVEQSGMLIDGWTDNSVIYNYTSNITSPEMNNYTRLYNIGDTIGKWNGDIRSGVRCKRINVKEGDKLVLDILSNYIHYSVIFTDKNLVITGFVDGKRADGVYTVPTDGYAYLMDVLYRENYLFSKANGYLAYQMYDNRKKVVSVRDWYNECCPFILSGLLPFEYNSTPTSTAVVNPPIAFANYSTFSMKKGLIYLMMLHIKIGDEMEQTSLKIRMESKGANTLWPIFQQSSILSDGLWIYMINTMTSDNGYSYLNLRIENVTANKRIHLIADNAYVHSFDSVYDAIKCANGISDGTLTLDGFKSIPILKSDPIESAVRMASLSSVGYDIVDAGAELPIDSEGVKFAIDNKGKAATLSFISANKNKIVYLPLLDWSGHAGVTRSSLFASLENMVTIPQDFDFSSLTLWLNTFYACRSLKKVGDITAGAGGLFAECGSLTEVGNITILPSFNGKANAMFNNCGSLKSIKSISSLENCADDFRNMFNNCVNLEAIPDLILPTREGSAVNMQYAFYGCIKITESPNINSWSKVATVETTFYACSSMTLVKEMDTVSCTRIVTPFLGCSNILRIERIDLSSVTTCTGIFRGCEKAKYILVTNLGKSSLTSYDFSGATAWGTTTEGHQSLYDSLYTYSDPAQNITVKLSANSYNSLTSAEISAINGKGITLTHS